MVAEIRPTWPLEFAIPVGHRTDLEFNRIRADSMQDAATTTALPVDFYLLPRLTIHVSDTGSPALSVREMFFASASVLISSLPDFRRRQEEPWGGEERTRITAIGAVSTVMTRRVAHVRSGELRDPIRQIRNTDLLPPLWSIGRHNGNSSAEDTHHRDCWAGSVRAGNTDHAFDTAIVGSHFVIANGPIHVIPIPASPP